MKKFYFLGSVLLLLSLGIQACGGPGSGSGNSGTGDDGGSGSGSSAGSGTGTDGSDGGTTEGEPQANCGNGVLENGEECDDGNKIESDACRSDCKLFTLEQHVWSRSFGAGQGTIENFDIVSDSEGNTYIAGEFRGRINLGGDDLINANEEDSLQIDFFDVFLAKFDKDGGHLWSKSFPFPGLHAFSDLAIDSKNNLIVAGYYNSIGQNPVIPLNFSDDQDPNQDLPDTIPAASSPYLAKFDENGHHLWSKSFQAGLGNASSVVVNADGEIYLTGENRSTANGIDFGGGALKSSSEEDVYLAKFSPEGNFIWSKIFPGSSTQYVTQANVDSEGNLVLIGSFLKNIDFGGNNLVNTNDNSNGFSFIAKFKPDGSTLWAKGLGDTNAQPGILDIDFDGQNRLILSGFCSGSLSINNQVLCNQPVGSTGYLLRFSADGDFIDRLSLERQTPVQVLVNAQNQTFLLGESGLFSSESFPIKIGDSEIPLAGTYASYLAQLDAQDHLLWGLSYYTESFGPSFPLEKMALDSKNNVILAGKFYSDLSFGGDLLIPVKNEEHSFNSFYLVKLKP